MNQLSTRSVLHRRMSAFVDWIRMDESKVETIRKQSAEIRLRIRGQAEKDGLTIRSTPNSGSFEKKTGLRRHLQGESDVEGQDIDLPFVTSPQDEGGKRIDELLNRFERYAAISYPETSRTPTRSSIQLDFVGTKLRYDLVPMLAVPGDDGSQILLRKNGEQRRTSVQKHIDFVTRRTGESNNLPGRVKFNECVRLVKWWREFRQVNARVLKDVPSIVIDLMCAHAYDHLQVRETYAETLAQWFSYLAATVQKRHRIAFKDFCPLPAVNSAALWEVLDPVNLDNNIVSPWNQFQVEELGEWLEKSCDILYRAIAADLRGDEVASMTSLVEFFGNPFKHHCEAVK
ncbi:CBASS oligonucleotide cyclase [Stigmatella sp. ncwal1]|uniref:CBASS oligonucleotide cyclase n=1 Tax=Stigmatella ashevillensis TaxID=2995309 RepID=A0ABT5D7H7_9BACT|nr:CBASS oligonucleotide cyclase [Stigmatella ashevillena]MDC0709617.1 CBASS oligonucleotide cyclase [Stigmatella ashevillena]